MHNKGRKNLHKYLSHASSADDVVNNHAYGKVARSHRPIPKRRPGPPRHGAVASYRDSMVGSIHQYRSGVAPKATDPKAGKETENDAVIGNRPRSGASDAPKPKDASMERRHHFIEPPKRGFNRFG